jgi:hypothetical protein
LPIGLKITQLSYDEWSALVAKLQRVHRSLLWLIGDALVWGEEHLGEMFSQAISEYSIQVQYTRDLGFPSDPGFTST